MNRQMWSNAAIQRNVAQLRADGVQLLGPDVGEMACMEHGEGRMLEATELFAAVVASCQPKVLAGKVQHCGAYLRGDRPRARDHQLSSGKIGFALTRAAAAEAGASVVPVAGHTELPTRWCVSRVSVLSRAQMAEAERLHLQSENQAQDALGSDEKEVILLDESGATHSPLMPKVTLTKTIVRETGRRQPR